MYLLTNLAITKPCFISITSLLEFGRPIKLIDSIGYVMLVYVSKLFKSSGISESINVMDGRRLGLKYEFSNKFGVAVIIIASIFVMANPKLFSFIGDVR